jgi:hypothetical protein
MSVHMHSPGEVLTSEPLDISPVIDQVDYEERMIQALGSKFPCAGVVGKVRIQFPRNRENTQEGVNLFEARLALDRTKDAVFGYDYEYGHENGVQLAEVAYRLHPRAEDRLAARIALLIAMNHFLEPGNGGERRAYSRLIIEMNNICGPKTTLKSVLERIASGEIEVFPMKDPEKRVSESTLRRLHRFIGFLPKPEKYAKIGA